MNGNRVVTRDNDSICVLTDGGNIYLYDSEDIKSIVTAEQYKSIEYLLEEE